MTHEERKLLLAMANVLSFESAEATQLARIELRKLIAEADETPRHNQAVGRAVYNGLITKGDTIDMDIKLDEMTADDIDLAIARKIELEKTAGKVLWHNAFNIGFWVLPEEISAPYVPPNISDEEMNRVHMLHMLESDRAMFRARPSFFSWLRGLWK